MVFSTISLIVIRVPLAKILSGTSLGIVGIWYAMLITYLIPSVCGLIYCIKLVRGQGPTAKLQGIEALQNVHTPKSR
jgi:Na+-driven multidrug efflux pump